MRARHLAGLFLLPILALLSTYVATGCAGGNIEEGHVCGNGVLDSGEECDGSDIGAASCTSLGFPESIAMPGCTAECKLDPTPCRCVNCTVQQTRCNGEKVEMCVSEGGCHVWKEFKDCGAEGKRCVQEGTTAQCKGTCDDTCDTEGDTRCSGNTVEQCVDTGTCLAWTPVLNCDNDGKVCQDGTCICEGGCVPDTSRCNGDVVERCVTGQNGCASWEPVEDCAARGELCSDADGTAMCVAQCTDDCPRDGALQCNGDEVQTCSLGQDGCLHWVTTQNCADEGKTCSNGQCQCNNECTLEGDSQCQGDTVQICTADQYGCLKWVNDVVCSDTGRLCQNGACVCNDQCTTEGDGRCSGNVVERCTRDQYGCLDWQAVDDCAALYLSCQDGTCVGYYRVEEIGLGNFTAVTSGYTELTSSADDRYYHVNLPFTFRYYGIDYTSVYISTNGWIAFDTADPGSSQASNSHLPSSSKPDEALYPFWDDLNFASDDWWNYDRSLRYATQGTAPNRVFVVEWKEVGLYDSWEDDNVSDAINFQVRLYEGTNVIEFLYDRGHWDDRDYTPAATIGIESATVGHAIDLGGGSYFSRYPSQDYRFTPLH